MRALELAATASVPWVVTAVLLGAPTGALAQGRSPIVLDCDGAGTTIVKSLGDSRFQVQQRWATNQVNGIQSFADGSFAFVNCTPEARTVTDARLSCSVFDEGLQRWSSTAIATTVGTDFLDGPYLNPLDELGALAGEYLLTFEIGNDGYSFRLRYLDGLLAQGGFPVLVGQSAPQSQTFLVRDVDRPDGAQLGTNFTIGIQYENRCFDLGVTPSSVGGVLLGSLTARVRDADGTCGAPIADDQPVALVPSGARERYGRCRYRVVQRGTCLPADTPEQVRDVLCLFCIDECRELPGKTTFLYSNVNYRQSAYVDCLDFELELETPQCSMENECEDSIPAVTILTSPAAAATENALAAHGVVRSDSRR